MDIELLTQPLEISENPGLDTLDPRFSDIATLVQEPGPLTRADVW